MFGAMWCDGLRGTGAGAGGCERAADGAAAARCAGARTRLRAAAGAVSVCIRVCGRMHIRMQRGGGEGMPRRDATATAAHWDMHMSSAAPEARGGFASSAAVCLSPRVCGHMHIRMRRGRRALGAAAGMRARRVIGICICPMRRARALARRASVTSCSGSPRSAATCRRDRMAICIPACGAHGDMHSRMRAPCDLWLSECRPRRRACRSRRGRACEGEGQRNRARTVVRAVRCSSSGRDCCGD